MKTFEDIKFTKVERGLLGKLQLANGFKISVGAGEGYASILKEDIGRGSYYESFEVAILDKERKFYKLEGEPDDVIGFQSRLDIDNIIKKVLLIGANVNNDKLDGKMTYFTTLEAMAALNSIYTTELGLRSLPKAKVFERVLSDTEEKATRQIISENSASTLNEVSEYNTLLNLIPHTSYKTIEDINSKITNIFKDYQNKNLYNPCSFFNIYFLLNTSTQLDFSNSSVFSLESRRTYIKHNDNFAKWFANSKVIENNKPLVVFHGTGSEEFTKFSFDKFPIAYFAENFDYSDWFSKARGSKGTMFKCYLRIQNPLDLRLFGVEKVSYNEFVGYIELKYGYKLPLNKMLKAASDKSDGIWAWQYLRGGVEWLKMISSDGVFDGIKYYENNPSDLDNNSKERITPAWAVFKPEQIKSALGNVTFSYNSEDVRFNKGGNLK
jgi:hypothetical protein